MDEKQINRIFINPYLKKLREIIFGLF